jgi:hypothetical protein
VDAEENDTPSVDTANAEAAAVVGTKTHVPPPDAIPPLDPLFQLVLVSGFVRFVQTLPRDDVSIVALVESSAPTTKTSWVELVNHSAHTTPPVGAVAKFTTDHVSPLSADSNTFPVTVVPVSPPRIDAPVGSVAILSDDVSDPATVVAALNAFQSPVTSTLADPPAVVATHRLPPSETVASAGTPLDVAVNL